MLLTATCYQPEDALPIRLEAVYTCLHINWEKHVFSFAAGASSFLTSTVSAPIFTPKHLRSAWFDGRIGDACHEGSPPSAESARAVQV